MSAESLLQRWFTGEEHIDSDKKRVLDERTRFFRDKAVMRTPSRLERSRELQPLKCAIIYDDQISGIAIPEMKGLNYEF